MTTIKWSGFNFLEIRELFLKGVPGARVQSNGHHTLEIIYSEKITRPEIDEQKIVKEMMTKFPDNFKEKIKEKIKSDKATREAAELKNPIFQVISLILLEGQTLERDGDKLKVREHENSKDL